MKKRLLNRRIIATIFVITILLASLVHSATAYSIPDQTEDGNPSYISMETASALMMLDQLQNQNQPYSKLDVQALQDATPPENRTDTDGDGLWDPVEAVLGTDFNNTDSDFDKLSDYDELLVYDSDPLRPDSNEDGLPDYFEVDNVTSLDLDGDGFLNVWDRDNDDDGVIDALDLSKFSKSAIDNKFLFHVETNGNPTYINFQLKPENSEHLKLFMQKWDWPFDEKGSMMDLDDSVDDVEIIPMLELKFLSNYHIIAKNSPYNSDAYLSWTGGEDVRICWEPKQWWLEPSYYYAGCFNVMLYENNQQMCMEVKDASIDDNARVILNNSQNSIDATNQDWKLEPAGDGYYRIIAGHSNKCLQSQNSSTCTAVFQSTCTNDDNQLWKLEPVNNVLPDQSEVEDYAISMALDKAYVPLSPIPDYGTDVVLAGRMFFPESAPLDLSMFARLIWMVNGKTDTDTGFRALRWSQEPDAYVSLQGDKLFGSTNVSQIGDNETFELIYVPQHGSIALKANNGMYVSAPADAGGYFTANSSEIGDREEFSIFRELAASGDSRTVSIHVEPPDLEYRFYAMSFYPNDYLNSTRWSPHKYPQNHPHQLFELVTVQHRTDTATIVQYYENFMLTGFSVEENYGSDVGLFYSDDKNQTIAANLVMAYNFQRSQTPLTEMPANLTSYNVTVTSQIRSFMHQDEALLNLTTNMIPEALNSLPEGQVLPVIAAFEDKFTSKQMDEFVSSSYITGSSFYVYLTNEPVITTKMVKTNLYNTTTKEALEIDEIMAEIQKWGLNEDSSITMMNLMLAWNAGERTVTKIGSDVIAFDTPEAADVTGCIFDITDYGLSALSLISDTITSVYAVYCYFKFVNIEPLATTAGQSSWRLMRAMCDSISNIKSGFLGVMNRISTALNVLGIILVVAVALYTFFAIAIATGWTDLGTFVAIVMGIMMLAYGLILIAIGCIPVVGWLIAALIALSDLIVGWIVGKGWSEMLMEAIIDAITEITPYSEVDLTGKHSYVQLYDIQKNGLTHYDYMYFKSRIIGSVTRTSKGTAADIDESYIKPTYKVPSKPYYTGSGDSVLVSSEYAWDRRNDEYETEAMVTPKTAMINLPVTLSLYSDYRIYYEECMWYPSWGWDCDREEYTGTEETGKSTYYFDVLPETLDDFITWSELTRGDNDGDGLFDSNETSIYGTDPWKWDTDGDGLSDKYEVDMKAQLGIDLDPIDSDTDGDGLTDRVELLKGTDPTLWDTDGDLLSDYFEVDVGWVISFNYSGQQFNHTVHSDPRLNDTDGDGVDDRMEYLSNLNPRSSDTDGDGVMDVANPKLVPVFMFEMKWGELSKPLGVAVDSNDHIYVANYEGTIHKYYSNGTRISEWEISSPKYVAFDSNGYVYVTVSNRIQKFDSNGNYILQWGGDGEGDGEFYDAVGIAVDSNDHIYVVDWRPDNSPTNPRIQKFYSDGTFITKWNTTAESPGEIAVDSTGYVYVSDGCDAVLKYDSNGTFLMKFSGIEYSKGVAVDSKGYVYVSDGTSYVKMFNSEGVFITKWGGFGSDDGQFYWPAGVAFDSNGFVYVADFYYNHIQKFSQITTQQPRNATIDDTDIDDDGLTNENETLGWDVTFTNATGTYTIQVTSEPLTYDTDSDGLTDYEEFVLKSNPRDIDTDDDGLSDFVESVIGTNITHYDTEGDGLDDYTELTFGSIPTEVDSDDDQLPDTDEFLRGSNPMSADTDNDGLEDYTETQFNTSLLRADSDNDLLMDGEEYDLNGEPNNPDTDGDGLIDGYEVLYNTNLLANDTDADGINDGEEIEKRMNPLSNDTDGDGLDDFTELEYGTNPISRDTRGNGLNDSEDPYSFASTVEEIALTYDVDTDTIQFVENLEKYTNVTIFPPWEIANYSSEPNILIVGRPSPDNNTAGNITHSFLNESFPDILARMQQSDYDRFYVGHDIWSSPQTVVMLSHPYPSDHFRVLDMFKTLTQPITYPKPVDHIIIDAIREMDAYVRIDLETPVQPTVGLKAYNATTVPHSLTTDLPYDEREVGKYLEINYSENVQNETFDNVKYAYIALFYSTSELDRTGDGDANDPGDIDEKLLIMNWFNTSANRWEKLTTDLDWVYDIGVNITNVTIQGKDYGGWVWANVSQLNKYAQLSMYGLSGGMIPINATVEIKPEVLNLKSDDVFTAFVEFPEEFSVSAINASSVVCEGAHAIEGTVAQTRFIAKFNVQDLVTVSPGDAVSLTVTGNLNDGIPFVGNYTITVIRPPE